MIKTYLFPIFFFICWTVTAQSTLKLKPVLTSSVKIEVLGKPSPESAAVRINQVNSFVSADGNKKDVAFDSIAHLHGNFWKIWSNQLQGIFHTVEGLLIPPVYEDASMVAQIDQNWAFGVTNYGMNAIVDKNNKILLPYQADCYQRLKYAGDTILGYLKKDRFNPSDNDLLFISKNKHVPNLNVARQNLTNDFKRISNTQYVIQFSKPNGQITKDTFAAAEKFIDNIALVKKDSLWGYLNYDGSWLIRPRYLSAQAFDAKGLAVIKYRNTDKSIGYGVIDKRGQLKIEPKYAMLKSAGTAGLFEYKIGGKIGLIDENGKVLIPEGQFAGFGLAGTSCVTAKSGDSLLLFKNDGSFIRTPKLVTCAPGKKSENFSVRSKLLTDRSFGCGVMSPDGKWIIDNVFKQEVKEQSGFFVAETVFESCCTVNGLNMGNSLASSFLIFDLNGRPIFPYAIKKPQVIEGQDMLIYQYDGKYGIIEAQKEPQPASYDFLQSLGNGWLLAKRSNEWSLLRF
jgi:WG containing repeat